MSPRAAFAVILAAAGLACRAPATRNDPAAPTIEIVVRVPWDDATLARSLVPVPPTAEVDPDARRGPELPLVRVHGGTVAVLNRMGDRYAPAATLRWWRHADGITTAATAPYPFAPDARLRGVDFALADDGALLLLETVAGPGGADVSRLARVTAGGDARRWDALVGGPYDRIAFDDRGRVLLVARGDGNTIVELELATAAVTPRAVAAPGTRAALAANRAAVVPSALLADLDPARVAAPPAIPGALGSLFGFDRAGAYYTVAGGELLAVDFGGRVLARMTLADHAALAPVDPGPRGLTAVVALPLAWQVDADGAVYVPRGDAAAFEVVRIRR